MHPYKRFLEVFFRASREALGGRWEEVGAAACAGLGGWDSGVGGRSWLVARHGGRARGGCQRRRKEFVKRVVQHFENKCLQARWGVW